MTLSKISALYFLIFLLAGCAGTYKSSLDFNPSEPLRVAVLPFIAKDSSGNIVNQEGRLLVDNIGFISTPESETPAQIVRKALTDELRKTALDLVSGALIDIDLPHHGYGRADGTLDLEKVIATPPAELCSGFLSCDAVLCGTLTRWDRSYYGIETVNTVGIELSLVSAKSGAVLFSASAQDSESRGLSKIPTGFSSIVLEPIKGLDSEIIRELSKSIVQKMIKPLIPASRPQFIDSSPPAIYAASHDGSIRKITQDNPVSIVMYGSESAKAAFSIQGVCESVPMLEISPGHYYGEFIPLPTDNFSSREVSVSLLDSAGRRSMSRVHAGTLSYP